MTHSQPAIEAVYRDFKATEWPDNPAEADCFAIKPFVKVKIVYILHPVAGDVDANLARIRAIVKKINTEPQYAGIVPIVPYYVDFVTLNDQNATEKERHRLNVQYILKRQINIREVWLFGDKITDDVRETLLAAFASRIKVIAQNPNLFDELKTIYSQWAKQSA